MSRLDGKVALVSGGAAGLGAAYCRALAAEGARVVVTDVAAEAARAVAGDCGPHASSVALDVVDESAWAAATDHCRRRYGRLDVLVNNAGIVHRTALMETDAASFQRVLEVNAFGTFLGMKAVVPLMREGGGGSIVNVSSTAGVTGFPGIIGYTAGKWAVRGMTKAAAVELAPYGVRVNTIVPGLVETPMTAGFAGPGGSLRRKKGSVDEVAPLVVFLASDESAFCTGADFVVDGGETAATPAVRSSP
ncbi:SDR family NAD(P)-dependent oxidoreductase [Nonomuraea sp. NPDC050478]|uniref:SDR family NAD(P)-dependent oxidoreductase n=1 Tax=Nonomuraea sp. NPDC050478 TaxID=3364365 RepID=UPI003787DE53